jgi:hypothetical protein
MASIQSRSRVSRRTGNTERPIEPGRLRKNAENRLLTRAAQTRTQAFATTYRAATVRKAPRTLFGSLLVPTVGRGGHDQNHNEGADARKNTEPNLPAGGHSFVFRFDGPDLVDGHI